MDELGLFPLPLVLLPTERVPLHVFEDRYKDLVGECIAAGATFGLLLDGAAVGTRARVAEVLDRFDDGRLNVVVEGVEPFRIVRETSGRSFATALVEPLADEDDPADAEEVAHALGAFRRLASATGSEVEVPDDEEPLLAFAIAARVAFANETKQQLLELRSPRLRLVRLAELLDRALDALERERQIQERASGNGKVTPLSRDD